ncbi:MAG: DsrE family protein [Nitrospiraceae bacterium]
MKTLAIIVSRGTYSNILRACEWVRLAVAEPRQVSVFFCDEAASRLTKTAVKNIPFSDVYRGRETKVRTLLQEQRRDDVTAYMRAAKESGDVKFSVCRDSLQQFDVLVEDLIPELDEVQTAAAFWKEAVAKADDVMTL